VSPVQPADLGKAAQAWLNSADLEGRDLSVEERWSIQRLLDHAEAMKGPSLGQQLGPSTDYSSNGNYGFGPGDRFVASEGFRRIKDASSRGQTWSTGAVDVGMLGYAGKGTLLEAPGGGGAGLVSVPYQMPGLVERLFQPLTIEALLSGGQTSSPTVRTIVEGTAVSGAAGVAEGGLKPQSTLGYTTTDEAVKKVATVVHASDELLEDVASVATWINSRVALFVQIETERQLIRGTSGGNEVQGLLTSRNVPIYAGGTAAGNRAVQLFKAMNGMRGSAFVEPDWIVLSPADYEVIRLLTDTTGQFFGGGPFLGPYGGPQGPVGANGQVSGATDQLWGKPVHVTSAVGAGTAIVGTRAGAQVMSRGGLSVEASNSAGDNFVHDLVSIRAERRLALCVLRSQAFVEVRLS
jgi:HK97 family phage major capsid protein